MDNYQRGPKVPTSKNASGSSLPYDEDSDFTERDDDENEYGHSEDHDDYD